MVSLNRLRERSAPTPTSVRPENLILESSEWGSDIRSRPGERLEQLFEAQCRRMRERGRADHLVVDAVGEALTYSQLNTRANQLARYLLGRGIGPGHRVALLLADAVHAYVGMLAVLKAGAAYVPLDPGFPPDRVAFIVSDAGVSAALSQQYLQRDLGEIGVPVVCLDEAADAIAAVDDGSLGADERGELVDELAYIIYTSGSTGRPKGVAIEHASICNFVRVAAEVYGIRAQDRVYQGMTIAFDFSVEEIWVPWMAGATLVPKPAGSTLLGLDLHAFLAERRVTALCCVPTLLATIEEDLPELRFLLVSGEACPQDLIARWYRPGRRFLNVYGPTEATVTATWTTLHPDRPVTIGQPLPTYTTVILDPENPHRALPHGVAGEIGIAGIGLAIGYLNRDDLTDKAFIPDFLGIAGNPSGRIYRTGDLGRVNEAGEIEYLGRIDLQVKIRGYRIELTEVESVLLQVAGVAAAVVDTVEPTPGTVELVGYYSLRSGVTALEVDAITAHLRERLPSYMVPAYLEHLAAIPMTPQDKVDRRALPAPSRRAGAAAGEHVAAATDTERVLAGALARTLGLDEVSVDSHFFDDLGANSLLMAQFSARVRRETPLPAPSMREIYQCGTIRVLAQAVGGPVPAAAATVTGTVVRGSTVRHFLTGTAQLFLALGALLGGGYLLVAALGWVAGGADPFAVYQRCVVVALVAFAAACTLPVLAKWVLVGRFRSREIPLWGMAHFRFWLVAALVRRGPLVLFAGSPLYVLYLRALGARIGRGVVVLSRTVPVCTDLLRIGAGAVVRKDSSFTGYRARAGRIETGAVTIGRDAVVGEASVLDIGTRLGDAAQLGHASSLQTGQVVPDGERWHGSPAEPTGTDFRAVEPRRCGTLRRGVYSALQLALVALLLPLVPFAVVMVPAWVPALSALLGPGHDALLTWDLHRTAMMLAATPLVIGLPLGLLTVLTLPRLLNLVRPVGYPPALRHPVLARPGDLHAHQHRLHPAARRQRLRHPLPRVAGLPPGPGGADRLELRPGHEARHPVSHRRRAGIDDLRRAVDLQRRLLQHVVPRRAGVDRAAQLLRQPHHRPDRQHRRRELPRRDQGHGPDRRRRAPRRGAARFAAVRDPALRPARRPVRPPAGARRTARPPCREDPAQRGHGRAVPAGAVVPVLRRRTGRRRRRRPVLPARGPRDRRRRRRAAARVAGHADFRRAGLDRVPGPDAPVLLDLRAVLLGAREVLEAHHHLGLRRLQRHRAQGGHLAAARRADRPPGPRRGLQHAGEVAGLDRRRHRPGCRQRAVGPLARGRHVQVRPRPGGGRVHGGRRVLRALRGGAGRRLHPRGRRLPDEGRRDGPVRPVARQPGHRGPRRLPPAPAPAPVEAAPVEAAPVAGPAPVDGCPGRGCPGRARAPVGPARRADRHPLLLVPDPARAFRAARSRARPGAPYRPGDRHDRRAHHPAARRRPAPEPCPAPEPWPRLLRVRPRAPRSPPRPHRSPPTGRAPARA